MSFVYFQGQYKVISVSFSLVKWVLVLFSVSLVSCKGYYDEYGIWNNGFDCPRWGGLDEEYCCGTQHEKYCCPEPDPTTTPQTTTDM